MKAGGLSICGTRNATEGVPYSFVTKPSCHMNFFLTLRIALRALAKNKLRAGLTVLGVVIGIAAVTTMVSLGQSASGLVQGQFESWART